MVDTLKGPGPFTVFAPTNAAFAALPVGTVDTLLKPENKPALTKVLTYHVVAGRLNAATLTKAIAAGGGKATLEQTLGRPKFAQPPSGGLTRSGRSGGALKTVSGGTIKVTSSGGAVMVMDESGGTAAVTIVDVIQSNGVIHVVDKVLLPK